MLKIYEKDNNMYLFNIHKVGEKWFSDFVSNNKKLCEYLLANNYAKKHVKKGDK